MGTLDALEWSRSWTKYPDRLGSKRIKILADLARDARSAARIMIAHHDPGKHRERRVEHRFAITRFTRIEILEALGASQLERVMVRKITLNQNLAGTLATAGSSCNLR